MAAFNEVENERSGPNFHGCGPFAHVGVPKDDVKPAIAARVHMRLVTRVDQRSPIHRVDANNHTEKIGALRDLINARLALPALRLNTHLAGARENLSRDEKRQNTGDDFVPCDVATHQVVVVTTVTVPGEVGIVLVEPNFVTRWQLLISAPCALSKNALAGFVLSNDLAKGCTLWRGIFRVRVIVVEPGAV